MLQSMKMYYILAASFLTCGFQGHLKKKGKYQQENHKFYSLLIHIVPSELHYPGDCLYLALGASVKGRAHRTLHKCFTWIL